MKDRRDKEGPCGMGGGGSFRQHVRKARKTTSLTKANCWEFFPYA